MDIKWKKAVTLILMFVMVCGLTACGNAKRQTDAGTKNEELHEPLTINRFNIYITEEFVNALHEVYPEINLQIVSYAGKNGSGYAQRSPFIRS